MRARVAILGTLGALATVGAGLLVAAPDVALVPPVRRTVEGLSARDPRTVLLAGTAIVGLYVVLAARSPSSTRRLGPIASGDRAFEGAVADPPEDVTDDRRQVTARALDDEVDDAIARGGVSLKRTRQTLSRTATSVYAHHRNVPRGAAQTAVETGRWTDDALAAAFLAGDEGPTPGVYSRIRLWLRPAAERERRIQRTVAAIQHLQEGAA